MVDISEQEREAVRQFMDPTQWKTAPSSVLDRELANSLHRELASGVTFEIGGEAALYDWYVATVEGDVIRGEDASTQEAAKEAAWDAFRGYWLLRAVTDQLHPKAVSDWP